MNITRTQALLMTLIVLVGIAIGILLLRPVDSGSSGGGSSHDDHDEHSEPRGRALPGVPPAGNDAGRARPASSPAADAAAVKSEHAGHESDHATDPAPMPTDGARRPETTSATAPGSLGRLLRVTPEQVAAAGIETRTAAAGALQGALRFQGEIRFNEDRTSHVVPRFAGVAESVSADLGQRVRRGQVLAVVASSSLAEMRSELLSARRRRELALSTRDREKRLFEDRISAQQDYQQAEAALQEADIAVSNATQKLAAVGAATADSAVAVSAGAAAASLNKLAIRAPFDATVVDKHLSLGEAVREDATIFTLSDLSTVWAEFAVAPKDLAKVRAGQKAVVSSTAFTGEATGTISYVGALLGEQTRSARARVTLANPDGAWRPGLFVTVSIAGEERHAAVTVEAGAVQDVGGQPTVFVQQPGGFLARPVVVGAATGGRVEVTRGLAPGERYAAANAFVLKSELGKSGAGHAH